MARKSSVISVLITGDAKGLNTSLGKADTALGKFGGAATAAVGAASAAIAGLSAVSVREFAKFDQALNTSLAIMGDVSDVMRTELSDAARDVAKTTTFSAEQAAESFYFLASAGLDAEASVSAMPKVAQFAQAGMFDMALATDLLTDAQSALGLTIRDDAAANMDNMVKVSDVLVRATTLANASTQQFSESLTNKAGAALNQLGKDMEEGVAVLAAFADQGIKGDYAGTQLGIVLRDLTTKGLKNADAFRELGVEVFDSTGEMNNLAAIIGDLEGALDGMSDAQQKATLLSMGFSDKSLASIQALLGQSEAIRDYEAALRDAGGTTEEVASKQLESFTAQVDLLKSQFVDVAISIGERLEPAISRVVDFLQERGPQIETFVMGVVDGIGGFLTAAREKGDEFRTAFDERFREPLSGFVEDVEGAIEDVKTKFSEVKSEGQQFVDALTSPFRQYNANADATALGAAVASAITVAFDELQNLAEPLIQSLKTMLASIDWFALGAESLSYIIQFGTGLLAGFFDFGWVLDLLSAAAANWEIVVSAVLGFMFAPAKWVGKIAQVLSKIPLFGRLLSWAATALNNLGSRIASGIANWVWRPFADAFRGVINRGGPGLIARFLTWARGIPTSLRTAADETLLAIAQFFENLGIRIANAFLPLKNAWAGLLDRVFRFIRGELSAVRDLGVMMVRGLWNGIKSMGRWIADKVRGFFSGIVDRAKSALGISSPSKVFADVGRQIGAGLALGIESTKDMVADATGMLTRQATSAVDMGDLRLSGARDGGGATTVNVTVTSADPEAVVEAIRRYTRRNGPLGASVKV